jgi:hypothetical protein
LTKPNYSNSITEMLEKTKKFKMAVKVGIDSKQIFVIKLKKQCSKQLLRICLKYLFGQPFKLTFYFLSPIFTFYIVFDVFCWRKVGKV